MHRNLFAPIDALLMRLTGGRVNTAIGIMPLVVLRTTGAKSGVQRDVALNYFTDGDDVILIASNYGQGKHPSWYYNLLKHRSANCRRAAAVVAWWPGRLRAPTTISCSRWQKASTPATQRMRRKPAVFARSRCSG